jgi:hypothetical protein
VTRRTADWLAPGAAGPVYGDLEVRAGGLFFVPETATAPSFSVPGPRLMRIGPGPAERARNAAIAGWHLIVVEDGDAAHLLKLHAADCSHLLRALVVEREREGLDAVPIHDGLGVGIGIEPEAPAPEEPDVRPPTAAERAGLAVGSLPSRWLALTAAVDPGRVQYVDGMSMLLELALLGLLDAPSRDVLVVAGHRLGRPTLDGAADRLAREPDWAVPQGSARRLGRYVRALRSADSTAWVTTSLREAIRDRHAADARTALLVWLLRQDELLKRVVVPIVFGASTRDGRRALHGWVPGFDGFSERPAILRAHRVLTAVLIRSPPTFGGG